MYQHPKKPNNDKVRSSSKGVALTENQVVDEIDKYNRKGVEDDATISKITRERISYKKYEPIRLSSPAKDKIADVAPKYEELKEIFAKCGEEME
ncbi:unnamed protein product [Rhizophagus irregularis]|nr:unnamed protein product [Rhizophagus irregularis]CAB4488717.1 unnamed protein product [Rhizophagus irregularis]